MKEVIESLKKLSATQLIQKMEKGSVNEAEKNAIISILKSRGKDTLPYENKSVEQIKQETMEDQALVEETAKKMSPVELLAKAKAKKQAAKAESGEEVAEKAPKVAKEKAPKVAKEKAPKVAKEKAPKVAKEKSEKTSTWQKPIPLEVESYGGISLDQEISKGEKNGKVKSFFYLLSKSGEKQVYFLARTEDKKVFTGRISE